MAVVSTRGLRKRFGEVAAVDGVDIASEEGEFLVLLGPSGCGKTTLLRMIAGLERPTEGDVLLGGRVVNELPPRARKTAMVFQSYALYPHMSVRRNIAFPLRALATPKEEIEKKVAWSAALLGLDGLLERKPRELSGGERQRVALARALVREPQVFLLDEPLSNLDAKLRTMAREELRRFQKAIGITTIYVTHDQVEAMGMGDRIALMDHGRVRQIGTPDELYHDPADTFVATFVGSPPMNLIEREGVLVGFRPERFLPREVAEADADAVTFDVDVTRVESLGSDRFVYAEVPAEGGPAKVISKLPSTVTVPIEEGRHYDFVVASRWLRFFDRSSGVRTERQRV